MLDIKFIRQNPEEIKEACRKKQINIDIDKFLELEEERRKYITEIEELRSEQNKISKQKITDEGQIKIAKELKEKIKGLQDRFQEIDKEFDEIMLQIPNIPHESVPEGGSDKENKEIKKWGKIPEFDFPAKDHIQLFCDLDLADFERGAKVSGFRGYFLKNEALLLCFAIWKYALDHLVKKGFTVIDAPSLVKDFNFKGTGWFPQGKDDVYSTQDDLYLIGTSEVSMMGYHADEVLKESELPRKYAAFSPCFRTEIGSYGKDTKGVFRIHEFEKVEQVIICKNDVKESIKWHEEITKNAEEVVQGLGLPYRVVLNCTGDLGLGQVKKYDIECWVPSEKRYRETHSSSYFFDFQTRRLNIRYREKDGTIKFAHSLNNTAIATPRILIQILENYQQKDGSVKVPSVLQKYLGFKKIAK